MTKPPAMPELPEPDYWSTRDDDTPLYTADQMRAYALAALQSAQPAEVSDEELRKAVDALRDPETVSAFYNGYYTLTPDELRRAILALRPAQQAPSPDLMAVAKLLLDNDREGALQWAKGVHVSFDDAGDVTLTAQQATPEPVGEPRDREADRARFTDPDFNRWLDEAITENGEHTVWDALKSTGDAYAGWRARPVYTHAPQQVPMPEPVQRLCRYAGQTMRTARNPNITAREAIEIGDYLAAIGITAQGAQGEQA